MDSYNRIEPETETHRTKKAVATLTEGKTLPLRKGTVGVAVGKKARTPVGQRILVLLVHLLARMKGVVQKIEVTGDLRSEILSGVPVEGRNIEEGIEHLVDRLSGPQSTYRSEIAFGPERAESDLRIRIGPGPADLQVGADAWRALTGSFVVQSAWDEECPIGPYMAGVIGASEAFKFLLHENFGWEEGQPVDDLAFSLWDFGIDEKASPGTDVAGLELDEVAIAGAGAGGTATLYTLSAFSRVEGQITVVEPGHLKESNLGRYLMSTYEQVHAHRHKLESVQSFLSKYAPHLRVEPINAPWGETDRDWGTVVTTVDTAEARWDVQRSEPQTILEAGVMYGTLYTVLRVVPEGMCLECKIPPGRERMLEKRAARWGLSVEEVKWRDRTGKPVTWEDIRRLSEVQNRPVKEFEPLVGQPFNEVHTETECGDTPLFLEVPSQAPVLPLGTTAAGVVLAAEVVKESHNIGTRLHNLFMHDLRYVPRSRGHRFKPSRDDCERCATA